MWPYRLSLEVTTYSSLLLGLFVLLQNRRARINQVFFIFSIVVAIYSFFLKQTSFSHSPQEAMVYGRLMYLGVILIPPVYYQLTLLVTKIKSKITPLFYGIAFFYLAALPSPIFISGVRYFNEFKIYSQVPGWLYHTFLVVFFSELLYSWYIAIKAYKICSGLQRIQLGYFIYGSGIGFVGGFIDYLPKYGIFIPYLNAYCNYLIVFYVFSFAYAIIKYRLMDIQIVFYKGLIYSSLITILTAAYLFAVFVAGQFLQARLGYSPILVGGGIIFVFVFALLPLRNRLQSLIDKLFFKSKYEYQQTLKKLSRLSTSDIQLDTLAKTIIDQVTEVIKIDSASILTVNPAANSFDVVHYKKGGQ